ncbi:hypothetical protein RJZ57_006930 [Blastomyces gilchristii]
MGFMRKACFLLLLPGQLFTLSPNRHKLFPSGPTPLPGVFVLFGCFLLPSPAANSLSKFHLNREGERTSFRKKENSSSSSSSSSTSSTSSTRLTATTQTNSQYLSAHLPRRVLYNPCPEVSQSRQTAHTPQDSAIQSSPISIPLPPHLTSPHPPHHLTTSPPHHLTTSPPTILLPSSADNN